VGVRYDLVSEDGQLLSIVARRTGDYELAVYDRPGADQAVCSLQLDAQSAATLVRILGAAPISARTAELSKAIPGLETARIELAPGSPFVGKAMGETRARTRTGVSIVAVVSGQRIVTSPGPDFVLSSGDMLVAIGTSEALSQVADLLERG
jgi:TrkA domain protein